MLVLGIQRRQFERAKCTVTNISYKLYMICVIFFGKTYFDFIKSTLIKMTILKGD